MKITEPSVDIIVLAYNAMNDVLDCLESLANVNYVNYKIIVVDNASTDGTYEAVKQNFPHVKLIRNEKNLGRTGGYNEGLKYSDARYVLFLDQDTVVDKNLLTELVRIIECDSSIGAVGPSIYYYDEPKKIWSAGTSVNLLTGRTHFRGVGEIDRGQFNSVVDVQQHPTAILVRNELAKKIGGYDQNIFMVYCDADFSLKIWKAGYRIVLSPNAKLWHKVSQPMNMNNLEKLGAATPMRAFLIGKNRIIFMKRYASTKNFIIFLTVFLPLYLIYYSFAALIERRFDVMGAFWSGTLKGLRFRQTKTEQNFG